MQEHYLKVIEELGKALADKDGTISLQEWQIKELKAKLEEYEAKDKSVKEPQVLEVR